MDRIDLKQCKFSNTGFASEALALNATSYLVYHSNTPISSLGGYVGNANIHIPKSKSIDKDFHAALCGYNGTVSVGRTQTKHPDGSNTYAYQNVHFYTSICDTLDGYQRICYLFQKKGEDFLRIRETARSQGDNYSAYFKILERDLIDNDFKKVGSDFKINKTNIAMFIDILNKINEKAIRQEYILTLSSQLQFVKSNFFHTVYWANIPSVEDIATDDLIKSLFKVVNTCNDSTVLSNIFNSLTEMIHLIEIKKKFL